MHEQVLRSALLARDRRDEPFRLALAGAGFLGSSLLRQCARTPGLRVVALADRNPEKARGVLQSAGALQDGGARSTRAPLARSCSDPLELVEEDCDAIVDCTGDPELGAALGAAALERGHAFFANAEADATVGPALARRARARGRLYSGCGGDEHAEALRLVRYAELLGLEVVAAGKFKRFLDRGATPASVAPWAERHAQNPYMLAAFADGTKMSIEMALLANATELVPDVRGMHCARLEPADVPRALSDGQGGLLSRAGVVEVVLGAEPSTSVFIVVRSEDPALQRELDYLKLGPGPTYLLTRPFHLCGTELAASIAEALISGEPTIAPRPAPAALVFAAAKRALEPGALLERIGGTTHYGVIDAASSVLGEGLLPVGLARGARVRRGLAPGEPITLADVEVERSGLAWQLFDEACLPLRAAPGRAGGELHPWPARLRGVGPTNGAAPTPAAMSLPRAEV